MTATMPLPQGPARGRRRSRRSEEAILDATLVLLGEVGFSGLTIDGIAARAGVGKATIYRHWPGKAHLVVDAFRSRIPPMAAPDTGTLRGDLLTVVGHLVRGLGHSPLSRILPALVEASEQDPELERLFKEFGAERRAVLMGVLERAAARGELRDGLDLDLALELLIGPIFARRLVIRRPLTRGYGEALVEAVLPVFTGSWEPAAPPPVR
ncbi:MAG: TetR/AcrR family transcriptional regulator [Actinomycetota bacterium]|nr:TetR/AcrR family transcriptional regulator [Actinomycetota bacterium]